jgi:hypothetical protein
MAPAELAFLLVNSSKSSHLSRMPLLAFVRRLIGATQSDSLVLPKSAAEIPAYREAFAAAVRFTTACCREMSAPSVTPASTNAPEITRAIEQTLEEIGVKPSIRTGAASQCLKWSHYLAPRLARALNMRAWPTVGQIWFQDRCVFDPSWNDLRRWFHEGLHLGDIEQRQGLNWHAWITLESGEIIDPTYMSTLAKLRPDAFGAYDGAVVGGEPETAIGNHRYFPMAVGAEFFECMQARSSIPIIASDPGELQAVAVVLA